jgi:hypothetical protein
MPKECFGTQMIVPEKTIACIPITPSDGYKEFDMNFLKFLKPLNENHERDWFTSHFYKCLPLSIGNLQGFAFSVPFDFSVIWNGGLQTEDIQIFDVKLDDIDTEMNNVYVSSEFGHGIFTVHFPLILKTPPGVNLMTIAAPNFPIAGISPMTGVVEADNLKFTFTLNFKVDLVNVPITIPKDYPIMGILPIPRYFCDSFKMINAYDILDKDEIEEERRIANVHAKIRNQKNRDKGAADQQYFKGKDIENNKFKDHQLPIKTKYLSKAAKSEVGEKEKIKNDTKQNS